jgi:magnesium-transporting ATPase (P-type)
MLFTCINICHSIEAKQEKDNKKPTYFGQSADEACLLKMAIKVSKFGYITERSMGLTDVITIFKSSSCTNDF